VEQNTAEGAKPREYGILRSLVAVKRRTPTVLLDEVPAFLPILI